VHGIGAADFWSTRNRTKILVEGPENGLWCGFHPSIRREIRPVLLERDQHRTRSLAQKPVREGGNEWGSGGEVALKKMKIFSISLLTSSRSLVSC
jgi:hypothetical protein